jgi:tetraprenyl-beta-curcumene synthase
MNTISLLKRFITYIFPIVDMELEKWKEESLLCPDKLLSTQAVSSITNKSFHAQGGSIFALYPGVNAESLTRLIVSYQTISDYLDYLCDRAGIEDEDAFFSLHLSMTDALNPGHEHHDYYRL